MLLGHERVHDGVAGAALMGRMSAAVAAGDLTTAVYSSRDHDTLGAVVVATVPAAAPAPDPPHAHDHGLEW